MTVNDSAKAKADSADKSLAIGGLKEALAHRQAQSVMLRARRFAKCVQHAPALLRHRTTVCALGELVAIPSRFTRMEPLLSTSLPVALGLTPRSVYKPFPFLPQIPDPPNALSSSPKVVFFSHRPKTVCWILTPNLSLFSRSEEPLSIRRTCLICASS